MKLKSALRRLQWAWADSGIRRQVRRVEAELEGTAADKAQQPVIFFNASTRLYHLSLNAAFSLLASWRLRAEGIPVSYWVCHAGMVQCILGTNPSEPYQPPPCSRCIRYSRGLFSEAQVEWLKLDQRRSAELRDELKGRSLNALTESEYRGTPIGQLALPGLRWALRRHNLVDSPGTRALYRQYLASSANLVDEFERLLQQISPQAVVIFNGIMYPEAVLRTVARRMGVRVVSHEVGLRPYSAFFTEGEATFREIPIPREGDLSPVQTARLERYLRSRRQGRFSMAGIKFWPEMKGLPAELAARMQDFDRIVPVFTNVVFDTSQVHANTIYPHMFAWLDELAQVIRANPNSLFIIRAHPDEDRPGKSSRENVRDWLERSGLDRLPNARFIGPNEYISSYDLIARADFVLVYSSSIGLETAIEGVPVLSAGRARYTTAGAAAAPTDRDGYRETLSRWLAGDVEVRPDAQKKARTFLYNELFRASLDLSEFLKPYPGVPGMVTFSPFDLTDIRTSLSLAAIRDGIVEGDRFLIDE